MLRARSFHIHDDNLFLGRGSCHIANLNSFELFDEATEKDNQRAIAHNERN